VNKKLSPELFEEAIRHTHIDTLSMCPYNKNTNKSWPIKSKAHPLIDIILYRHLYFRMNEIGALAVT